MHGILGERDCGSNDCTSARAILAYLQLNLETTKIGKRCSLGQSPKVAANAVEWRRVLSLASYRSRMVQAVCKFFSHIGINCCMFLL